MSDPFFESLFRQAQRPEKGTALGKLNEGPAHVYHGSHPYDQDLDDAGAGEGGDYWYGNEPEDTHQAHYSMQVRPGHHETAPDAEEVDDMGAWGGYSSDHGRHMAPPAAAPQQAPTAPLQASMRQQQYTKDTMRLNKIKKEIAKLGIERQEIEGRLKARA